MTRRSCQSEFVGLARLDSARSSPQGRYEQQERRAGADALGLPLRCGSGKVLENGAVDRRAAGACRIAAAHDLETLVSSLQFGQLFPHVEKGAGRSRALPRTRDRDGSLVVVPLVAAPILGCCSTRMRCHRSQRSTRTGDEQPRESACAARTTSPPPARAKAPATRGSQASV